MYLTKHDIIIIPYTIAYMVVHFAWLLSAISSDHANLELLTILEIIFVSILGIYIFIVLKVFTDHNTGSRSVE